MSESEKIQKVLARAGYASRREVEVWIAAGRISVNGAIAKLGDRISEKDAILIDGHVPQAHRLSGTKRRVLAYYKPEGEVCTRADPEGRPTIFDRLPLLRNGRWVTVGRLDINTSGLILLTTDGELAHRLMHPSTEIEREYAVRVLGQVDKDMLQRLHEGVQIDDGMAHFDSVRDAGGTGSNHWYHVILKEGRNREVRRLWETQGVKISRLTRVRFGPVGLRRGLRSGRWEDLEGSEIKALLDLCGLQDAPVAGSAPSVRKPRGREATGSTARRSTGAAKRNPPAGRY